MNIETTIVNRRFSDSLAREAGKLTINKLDLWASGSQRSGPYPRKETT